MHQQISMAGREGREIIHEDIGQSATMQTAVGCLHVFMPLSSLKLSVGLSANRAVPVVSTVLDAFCALSTQQHI